MQKQKGVPEAVNSSSQRVAWLQTVIPSYRLPFLKRLAEREQIDVTCFHGEGREGYSVQSVGPNLPVKSVWVKNYFWPFGGPRAAWQSGLQTLLKGRFGVVVCSEAVHDAAIWALWGLRKAFGFRLVLVGYGFRPQRTGKLVSTLRDHARMLLLRDADAIIVYTERGRDNCIAAGLPREKIFINSNTVDTELLMQAGERVSQEELEAVREKHDLNGVPVLLYVGRLLPVKRPDVLIETVRKLNAQGVACRLLVIGDGHEREALEAQAAELDNVTFLGAIYDEQELAKYFMVSDLLVIPGRVGLTCVHGFSYGVPVLTSQGGVEQSPEYDYIVDGENGLLIEEPDAELYTEAIKRTLQDEATLGALKAGAKRSALSLSMSHMVDQFVAAVRYAAGARQRRREGALEPDPR